MNKKEFINAIMTLEDREVKEISFSHPVFGDIYFVCINRTYSPCGNFNDIFSGYVWHVSYEREHETSKNSFQTIDDCRKSLLLYIGDRKRKDKNVIPEIDGFFFWKNDDFGIMGIPLDGIDSIVFEREDMKALSIEINDMTYSFSGKNAKRFMSHFREYRNRYKGGKE